MLEEATLTLQIGMCLSSALLQNSEDALGLCDMKEQRVVFQHGEAIFRPLREPEYSGRTSWIFGYPASVLAQGAA